MYFIDTHFHLDLWRSPEEIISKIENNQIYTIAVTNTPSVFFHTENLTRDKKYIRPALGLHPELADQRISELPLLLDSLKRTRYIGEIGLDYSAIDPQVKKIQREIFSKIIDGCSHANDKILTVHSRKAEQDIIDIIGPDYPGKVILHWYSGPIKHLLKAIDHGFYFSINSAMVKSENGRKIIAHIPLNKLLTESDGPFTKIQSMPCSPLNIPEIIVELSAILNRTPEDLKQIIYDNFKSTLSVPSK